MKNEDIVKAIKDKEIQIEELRIRVQQYYQDNAERFQKSNWVRTSEIDENYKKIDSTFNAKSKLEGEVRNLKKQLLELMLNA